MKYARLAGLWAVFIGVAAAQMPTLNNNGVVNGASYVTTNPPGSLVVAFGTNLASKLLVASSTPLTTQIQGGSDDVWVTVNGKEVPVYYVAQAQLSVQLPWGTPTGNATMMVTRNGTSSSAVQFPVNTFSPGIFTTTANGAGMAWAINALTGVVAQPAGCSLGKITCSPAKAGDHLYVFVTGLGPVSPAVADGAAPCPLSGCPAGVKLSTTTTKPTVMVGGVPATVEFSGLSPQFVGVYQVNFKVPDGVPTGNTVQVTIQIGGATSNPATIATQ